MRRTRRGIVAAIALVSTTLIVAACGSLMHGEGSRHHIYSSIEEVIGDSTLVIEATIVATSGVETGDGVGLTSLTAQVATQYFPEGLGLSPVDGGKGGGADPKLDSGEVQVLQAGAAGTGPVPGLREGGTYLLFLTHSGLEGELAGAYFVTGAVAGIYESTDGGSSFTRVSEDDPALPTVLSKDDLAGWSPSTPG